MKVPFETAEAIGAGIGACSERWRLRSPARSRSPGCSSDSGWDRDWLDRPAGVAGFAGRCGTDSADDESDEGRSCSRPPSTACAKTASPGCRPGRSPPGRGQPGAGLLSLRHLDRFGRGGRPRRRWTRSADFYRAQLAAVPSLRELLAARSRAARSRARPRQRRDDGPADVGRAAGRGPGGERRELRHGPLDRRDRSGGDPGAAHQPDRRPDRRRAASPGRSPPASSGSNCTKASTRRGPRAALDALERLGAAGRCCRRPRADRAPGDAGQLRASRKKSSSRLDRTRSLLGSYSGSRGDGAAHPLAEHVERDASCPVRPSDRQVRVGDRCIRRCNRSRPR